MPLPMRFRVLVAGFAAALALSVAAAPVAANDPKDCSDFKTQHQAQKWFKHHHPHKDPAGLDADHDGKACEDSF